MTPTTRLTTALRGLADALEGPLQCSDPEMPARRLLDAVAGDTGFDVLDFGAVGVVAVPKEDAWEGHVLVIEVLQRIVDGADPIDILCDAGLCDE